MVKAISRAKEEEEKGDNFGGFSPSFNGEGRGRKQVGDERLWLGPSQFVKSKELVMSVHFYQGFVKIFFPVFEKGHTTI